MASPSDVKSIFLAASEKPLAERGAFLAEATAGDAALLARIEALLRAHDNPGSFLEDPAAEFAATVDFAPAEPPLAEQAGTIIGPYKLLQQIGEGGMGVVFMAEQTEPLHRTVALKIIKPGMDTRQVIARFEAERQALAMMDHANIAHVLEAGTTDTGLPYFVMDLVKGVAITDYCDQQQLTIRQRLELFTQVCQAVQHAHQKGIIHRDLKPSNVLVAEYDGKPVPKVIDFGVAKATAQRLTERTMFTEFGQLIGTFEYMSPEQARFNQLDVDTRSDIYSLGVLLYELLTGSTPLERARLRSAAFDEILRIIGEEEPPKPSTRLSFSQSLPSISAQRQIEPAKLKKLVRGELDWIAMKCLEKHRNRRYPTANALAADLLRYLADEPVEAKPATQMYRLNKFIRRNKAGVLAGSAVVAALAAGLVLASVGFIRARSQAVRADEAALRATATSEFLQEMFRTADPDQGNGQAYTVRQLLDRFSGRIEDQFHSDPAVEADIQQTIGLGYRRLDANKCEKHLKRAMELRRALVGEQNVEFAGSLVDYGIALREQWRARESEEYLRRALSIYQRQGTKGRPVIRALEFLQVDLVLQNRLSEVESVVNQAQATARQCPSEQFPEIANMYHGLIIAKIEDSKSLEAEVLARTCVEMHLRLHGPNHPETGWGYQSLGRALAANNKFGDAIDAFQQAALILDQALPSGSLDSVATLERLTTVLQRAGKSPRLLELFGTPRRLEKVESIYRDSIPTEGDVFQYDPARFAAAAVQIGDSEAATTTAFPGVATAVQGGLMALSDIYLKLQTELMTDGKPEQAKEAGIRARALEQEAISLAPKVDRESKLAGERFKAESRLLLVSVPLDPQGMNQCARILATAENSAQRDPTLATKLAAKAAELSPRDANIWNTLGAARLRDGDAHGAIEALTKSTDLGKGGDANDWFFLAMSHWQLGNKDDARDWYDKATEWMDKNQPKNEELLRFRAEAAELLGISESAPDTDPATKP